MELLVLFTNILDAHTRDPGFKPYLGTIPKEKAEGVILQEKIGKRSVFVRKPEIASGERFKQSIPGNSMDKTLTGRDSEQIPRMEDVDTFSRGKIRQAV